MKKKFVKSWNKSVQPRKQRKYIINAPLHLKSKLIVSNLSKELREKYSKRSLRVKKGDKVKVMRGQYSEKTGIIERVSVKLGKVYATGIHEIKKDGSKRMIPLIASNLQIIQLDLKDKKRLDVEA